MLQWLKKWWNLIFGAEYEVPRKNEPIRYGRIVSNERTGMAKVRHEYPRTGHFRFPLIPDEDKRVKNEPVSYHDDNERSQEEEPRENFKASDVPSPVYGFHERRRNQKMENEHSVSLQVEEEEDRDITNAQDRGQTSEQTGEASSLSQNQSGDAIHQDGEENLLNQDAKVEEPIDPDVGADPLEVDLHQSEEVEQVADARTSTEDYLFPELALLRSFAREQEEDKSWLVKQRQLLEKTLKNFKVSATVTDAVSGPAITRFEVQPSPGVKVNKITNLTDDIKLSLAAKDIRIEAPIPGKNAIGIEVPNRDSQPVGIGEVIKNEVFQNHSSSLAAAVGVDISGEAVVADLREMPHGLIAGATGSGKSVCIHSMLVSLLFKAHPDDVKLLLIDPKVVELTPYNDLPHLVTPVVTDVKEATSALKWAVDEMEERYRKFAETKVRDIEKYNETMMTRGKPAEKMAYIVIVIDELADLMMVSPQEVEDAICRIAQKARACGIHLLVATQRPSVDVITGLIKANIPTRIAFSVSSQVDSRTILDTGGAEKLLGKGDMLLLRNGSSTPIRLQGNFISDEEIERVTTFVKKQQQPNYLLESADLATFSNDEQEDKLFFEACEFIFQQGAASASSLQRRFRIGYNRAARLIDMMEEAGLVSKANGSKPRKVLQTKKEFYKKSKL